MKSRRGFTLVELLVTIVILGIITGISIPIIRNVQSNMTEKKYTTYLDSMKSSAKLYTDSYGEDMFGRNKAGVYCISYKQLEEKKLIKDISIDDVTCNKGNNTKKTFVRVTKLDDKYVYTPFLECVSESNINSVQKVLPKGNTTTIEDEFCDSTVNSSIIIDLKDNYVKYKSSVYDKKRRKAKIEIRSATGIYNDINVSYAWHNIKESSSNLNWTRIGFKVESVEKQKEALLNSDIIVTYSEEIITPEGGDGTYRLLIKVDNLKDIYGNSYNKENPKKFEFYAIDIDPPKIKSFDVKTKDNRYHTTTANVVIDAEDNHTANGDIKMCITTDASKCKIKSDFTEQYKASSDFEVHDKYDNTSKKVYIHLMDKAGNITSVNKDYKVGIKHILTYDSQSGSSCNALNLIHDKDDNAKWGRDGNLCKPSRTGYTFKGWYTEKNGKGNKVDENTVAAGNLKVYAYWVINTYTLTYKCSGDTNCNGKKITKKYGEAWNANCTPSRTGYDFNGWNGVPASASSNITATCKMTKKKYTLTYSCPGDTKCNGTKITKSYGDAWNANCTPSVTGYNFNGWNGVPGTATSNVTVTCKTSKKTYTLTYSDSLGSGCNGKTVSAKYGEAWSVNCTPSVAGTACKSFGGWSGVPAKATSNVTVTAIWNNVEDKWYLKDSSASLQNQQWYYCQGGSRVSDGEHDLPESVGGHKQHYLFQGGYAWCGGWTGSGHWWKFYGNEDLDHNGSLDCRMYHDESRYINGQWYEFDHNGWCTSPNC